MSDDDQTPPIDPDAPQPPPAAPAAPAASATRADAQPPPASAMPLPAGYPAYGVPPAQQRPRFADQVLGMRAVVAVALACLIIGGLSGFILGRAAGREGGGFIRGPGVFQRGAASDIPNGSPDAPSDQGRNGR